MLHGPVEVLRHCRPAAVAAVIYHPCIALKDSACPNNGALVCHQVGNVVGVCRPQDGHQGAETLRP